MLPGTYKNTKNINQLFIGFQNKSISWNTRFFVVSNFLVLKSFQFYYLLFIDFQNKVISWDNNSFIVQTSQFSEHFSFPSSGEWSNLNTSSWSCLIPRTFPLNEAASISPSLQLFMSDFEIFPQNEAASLSPVLQSRSLPRSVLARLEQLPFP